MELDYEIIKLKLAAPHIKHRARLPAQDSADGARR